MPWAAATLSSIALLGRPAGNLVPPPPSLTCLLRLGREIALIPPLGGLPSVCRSLPPRLPLFPGVHITSLHHEVQSPSQLAKLKETPSPWPCGCPGTQLLQGLPYHSQGLLYHVGCATNIRPILEGSLHCQETHHQIPYTNDWPPFQSSRELMAPPCSYCTAMNPADGANCLAAVQGWAGSHGIRVDRRKFIGMLGCLTCLYSGVG